MGGKNSFSSRSPPPRGGVMCPFISLAAAAMIHGCEDEDYLGDNLHPRVL